MALIVGAIAIGWSFSAMGATVVHSPYTLCIGRFAMDLPAGATVRINAGYQYIDILRPQSVESFDEVRRQLEARANKMKDKNIVVSKDREGWLKRAGYDPGRRYGRTQLIGFDVDASIYQAVLGYHPDPNAPGIITEVHKVIGGKHYEFDSKDGGADDFSNTRSALWSAADQFQPINNRTLPKRPGFCVEDGMFVDTGKPPVRENFTLIVQLAGHPDVRFTVDAHAIDKVNAGEPSLKHRVDSELGILRANVDGHVDVIERGELSAAGQDGYQIGISAPYDLVPGTVRKFFWSADGVPNDVTRPFMEIDLTIQPTDEGKSTIKDDTEAKALWDQLLHSLRIRPGAV